MDPATIDKISRNTPKDNVQLSQQLKQLERVDNNQAKNIELLSKAVNIINSNAGSTLDFLGAFSTHLKENKKEEAKQIIAVLEKAENKSSNLSSLSFASLDNLQAKIGQTIPKIDSQISKEISAKKVSNLIDWGAIRWSINSPEEFKQLNLDSDERIDLYEQSKRYFTDVSHNITQEKNARIGPPLPTDYEMLGKFGDSEQYQRQAQALLEQQSIYQSLLDYQNFGLELAQERLVCLDEENQKIIANTNIQNEFQKQQAIEGEKRQRLAEGQKFVDNYTLSDTEKVNQDEEEKIDRLNEWYALSQELNTANQEVLLEQEKLYQDAKLAIEEEASEKRKEIIDAEQQNRLQEHLKLLNSSSQLFSSMGELIGAFGGESSNAYKAMFAISKGFAIASTTLSMFTNIGKATEMGFPANIPLIAQAVSQGASIISSIKGTNLSGQAHAGINYIPKEGTWLLDEGERVLSPRQNSDLTAFLQNGSDKGLQIVINNNVGAEVTATYDEKEEIVRIAVNRAVKEVSHQLSSGTGTTSRALRERWNTNTKVN